MVYAYFYVANAFTSFSIDKKCKIVTLLWYLCLHEKLNKKTTPQNTLSSAAKPQFQNKVCKYFGLFLIDPGVIDFLIKHLN